MDVTNRISAFVELGKQISSIDAEELEEIIACAGAQNGWFTKESVQLALEGVGTYLNEADLKQWVSKYNIIGTVAPWRVGVVMAGNIPMVGFHDFISVLMSGHQLKAKLSSQDSFLIEYITKLLIQIEPAFETSIDFVEKMKDIDAIIATGSDNTARHFEYYFSKYPKIIRKNRTSIGVINGQETKGELQNHGKDILSYFGLGCRNVSKVYVPQGYDVKLLLEATEDLARRATFNHKYSNNYDYNKSIYLINKVPHLDNGGLLVTENDGLVSPISVLFYETYTNQEELRVNLKLLEEKIQCIVSADGWFEESFPFGEAQYPKLWDYADGVDTMQFLCDL